MRKVRHQEDAADVNITPLLDIVFIMLIFFIVTATFVYEKGIEPTLPPNSDTPPEGPPPPSMLLTVQNDGFVLVDDTRIVDPKSVRPVATEFFASNEKGVIIISAAPDSKSGVLVTVLDQARLAKIDGTIIVTKQAKVKR